MSLLSESPDFNMESVEQQPNQDNLNLVDNFIIHTMIVDGFYGPEEVEIDTGTVRYR